MAPSGTALGSHIFHQPADMDTRGGSNLQGARVAFLNNRNDFDHYARSTGFAGFWTEVYPAQRSLVVAYIVEAYKSLGLDLDLIPSGETLPSIEILPKHMRLMERLQVILIDAGLLCYNEVSDYTRSSKPVPSTPTTVLFEQMLQASPLYADEIRLLNCTGSCLAQCLTGRVEPLSLLFANKLNRELLADVYCNAPMSQACTQKLADYLTSVLSTSSGPYKLFEVGAGTGGTTRYLVDFLQKAGIDFEYTFTDISLALVQQAKKKFAAAYPQMKFAVFDCERAPPEELQEQFHVAIAAGCVHATSNASVSAGHIQSILRPNGILCLAEITRALPWMDLVFGLLDGWWLFSDSRKHILGDESFWDTALRSAGFRYVSWSDGDTEEAKTMRLFCGFKGDSLVSSDGSEDYALAGGSY